MARRKPSHADPQEQEPSRLQPELSPAQARQAEILDRLARDASAPVKAAKAIIDGLSHADQKYLRDWLFADPASPFGQLYMAAWNHHVTVAERLEARVNAREADAPGIIDLKESQGLSYSQIAKRLHISRAAAEQRYRRAKERRDRESSTYTSTYPPQSQNEP